MYQNQGILKEILELHKRGVWGTEVPSGVQGRSPGKESGGKHIVVYCNDIFEQFYAY